MRELERIKGSIMNHNRISGCLGCLICPLVLLLIVLAVATPTVPYWVIPLGLIILLISAIIYNELKIPSFQKEGQEKLINFVEDVRRCAWCKKLFFSLEGSECPICHFGAHKHDLLSWFVFELNIFAIHFKCDTQLRHELARGLNEWRQGI